MLELEMSIQEETWVASIVYKGKKRRKIRKVKKEGMPFVMVLACAHKA